MCLRTAAVPGRSEVTNLAACSFLRVVIRSLLRPGRVLSFRYGALRGLTQWDEKITTITSGAFVTIPGAAASVIELKITFR